MKGHHTAPTNLTELWTALANIWQVIPVECFQKLVESMPHHVVPIIKATGGSTRHYQAEGMFDHYLAEYLWRRSRDHSLSDETFQNFLKAVVTLYPPLGKDQQ
ncbi:hypothetical protein TNCV_3267971 [Trichonephila clavipes]|nr:hypothetical protein TNCV_3267971 [Trichonephila clavipes]